MMHLVLRCLLAVTIPAVLSQLPITAHAQPGSPDKEKMKAAKTYVDAGLAAQSSGDFDTAVTLYTKAYELVPHPVLLFNIAQVHRLAKRDDEAVKFYRKFLATEPTGPEARLAREHLAAIEKRKAAEEREAGESREADEAREADDDSEAREVTTTRKARTARAGAEISESSVPPRRPTRSPWYRDLLGDALLAGGVVSFALAGVKYAGALSALDVAQGASARSTYGEFLEAAHSERLTAVVYAGIGVALVGGAVLRYRLRGGGAAARRVAITPAPAGGFVTLTRSF
jgi:tetratricopeptide (TPR) repeat protein